MKKGTKKILVANARLNKLGGSETFTYTLIEELKSRADVFVEYFTFEKGTVSDKIENELGVSFQSLKSYDLILANHYTCVAELYKYGFIIQTCHGIYPVLEQPFCLADAYVSISQEVKTHLSKLGYATTLIYNGINTNRFYSKKTIHKKLNTVLSLCHSKAANNLIKSICEDLNVEYLQAYKYKNPVWNIEDKINESDLVVGLGRSAYEAMACGRPVVVYDNRPYFESCGDGYIKDKFELSLLNNCSGRYFKTYYDKESLKKEFLKYNNEDGDFFREVILKDFNIKNAVNQYIDLWDSTIQNDINKNKGFIKKMNRGVVSKFAFFNFWKNLSKKHKKEIILDKYPGLYAWGRIKKRFLQ